MRAVRAVANQKLGSAGGAQVFVVIAMIVMATRETLECTARAGKTTRVEELRRSKNVAVTRQARAGRRGWGMRRLRRPTRRS
jgi:hypothetical protein